MTESKRETAKGRERETLCERKRQKREIREKTERERVCQAGEEESVRDRDTQTDRDMVWQ